MQYPGKQINQTWKKMTKNLILGPIFLQVLPLLVSYTLFQAIILCFKGKLMNQTWENVKKPNFRPDFGLFDPNLLSPLP